MLVLLECGSSLCCSVAGAAVAGLGRLLRRPARVNGGQFYHVAGA